MTALRWIAVVVVFAVPGSLPLFVLPALILERRHRHADALTAPGPPAPPEAL